MLYIIRKNSQDMKKICAALKSQGEKDVKLKVAIAVLIVLDKILMATIQVNLCVLPRHQGFC